MTKMSPIYRDIDDWVILETKIINDYSENENPIEAVSLLIGTLHYEELDFNHHYIESRTPIIRWMTTSQYKTLLKNSGVIIW